MNALRQAFQDENNNSPRDFCPPSPPEPESTGPALHPKLSRANSRRSSVNSRGSRGSRRSFIQGHGSRRHSRMSRISNADGSDNSLGNWSQAEEEEEGDTFADRLGRLSNMLFEAPQGEDLGLGYPEAPEADLAPESSSPELDSDDDLNQDHVEIDIDHTHQSNGKASTLSSDSTAIMSGKGLNFTHPHGYKTSSKAGSGGGGGGGGSKAGSVNSSKISGSGANNGSNGGSGNGGNPKMGRNLTLKESIQSSFASTITKAGSLKAAYNAANGLQTPKNSKKKSKCSAASASLSRSCPICLNTPFRIFVTFSVLLNLSLLISTFVQNQYNSELKTAYESEKTWRQKLEAENRALEAEKQSLQSRIDMKDSVITGLQTGVNGMRSAVGTILGEVAKTGVDVGGLDLPENVRRMLSAK